MDKDKRLDEVSLGRVITLKRVAGTSNFRRIFRGRHTARLYDFGVNGGGRYALNGKN